MSGVSPAERGGCESTQPSEASPGRATTNNGATKPGGIQKIGMTAASLEPVICLLWCDGNRDKSYVVLAVVTRTFRLLIRFVMLRYS